MTGRILEEFITSQQLHILNEKCDSTTFRNRIGASNIDLTLITNHLLHRISRWEISDQESSSDHSTIKYVINQSTSHAKPVNLQDVCYITTENLAKFQVNLLQTVRTRLCKQTHDNSAEELDDALCTRLTEDMAIEKHIDDFSYDLRVACNKSFKTQRASKRLTPHKSVPWWTEELTIMRKRTNTLRRRYQRTRNNEELREKHKIQYYAGKAIYAATIKKEKTRSWKEYCNITSSKNPWNEVYKLAAGKRNTCTQITTLRKPDRSLMADIKETLCLVLDYFTPTHNLHDDNDYRKQVRAQAQKPVCTAEDRAFTIKEIRNAIQSMDNKKAPGEDGITSNIYKQTFQTFPKFITAMYNGCLSYGVFPKRWKRAKIIPIVKPGKENSNEVSKYRPISLLNVAGKVLE